MDSIILEYREWFKLKFNNQLKGSDETITKDIIDNGKLKKMMIKNEEGEIFFRGIRIVRGKKLKLESHDLI